MASIFLAELKIMKTILLILFLGTSSHAVEIKPPASSIKCEFESKTVKVPSLIISANPSSPINFAIKAK